MSEREARSASEEGRPPGARAWWTVRGAGTERADSLHAVRQLVARGWARADERVVVLNTGSALIQPETLPAPTGLLSPAADLPR